MKRVADRVINFGFPTIVEGGTSLAIVDPGCRTENIDQIEAHSRSLNKPVLYVVLTHGHYDHTGALGHVLKIWDSVKLVTHPNSPYKEKASYLIESDEQREFDRVKYAFLLTPGLMPEKDDMLSILLPDDGVLFIGDLSQPQGLYYEECTGVSPVPQYTDGEKYVESLQKLLSKEFKHVITADGYIMDQAEGSNALRLTLRTIEKTRQLAGELVGKRPNESVDTICEWIFDTIAYERGFSKERIRFRKTQSLGDKTHYQEWDKPGIEYFVRKAKSQV